MIEYFKLALSKYAQFTGRSRRSEYWYFNLAGLILYFTAYLVLGLGAGTESEPIMILGGIFLSIVALGLMIPTLAVSVRRLHDIGKSGWWYFIGIIPLVGPILFLVWMAKDSQPGLNQWGPNPKTGAVAGDVGRHLVD